MFFKCYIVVIYLLSLCTHDAFASAHEISMISFLGYESPHNEVYGPTYKEIAENEYLALEDNFKNNIGLELICKSPQLCLKSIQYSIDTADSELFELLVDIDALSEDFYNFYLNYIQNKENESIFSPMLNLFLSSLNYNSHKDDQNIFRDLFKDEIKNFIVYNLKSGSFAGKKVGEITYNGILGLVLERISVARKEIRHIAKPIVDGMNSSIYFSVYDYDTKKFYPIHALMEATHWGWRLVEIKNMKELMQIFHEEQVS